MLDKMDGEKVSNEGAAYVDSIGPRTIRGKGRSKRNAIKSGIYSDFLLTRESDREYRQLLEGFWEYWKPEGKPECTLVERLAMLLWRSRRVPQAEAAVIERGVYSIPTDFARKHGIGYGQRGNLAACFETNRIRS